MHTCKSTTSRSGESMNVLPPEREGMRFESFSHPHIISISFRTFKAKIFTKMFSLKLLSGSLTIKENGDIVEFKIIRVKKIIWNVLHM